MWACTRCSLWCHMGLITRWLLCRRNASSASVSWMKASEFFSAPVGHVAAQQITSLAQLHPIASIVAFAPAQLRPALRVGFHIHLEEARGAPVVSQKSSH